MFGVHCLHLRGDRTEVFVEQLGLLSLDANPDWFPKLHGAVCGLIRR